MKLTFALLIIIFLAFSGYHLSFRHFRLPYFARQFYLTGTEFLFLGLLLGPQFFNLLDGETQKGLAPVSALLLGWIGLFFGFQFEIKSLRRFPLKFFQAAGLEALLTLTVVFAGTYLTAAYVFDLSGKSAALTALTLSAAAACTSQTGLALFYKGAVTEHQNVVKFLRFISSMDGLVGLLFFGLAFFIQPAMFYDSLGLMRFGIGVLTVFGIGLGFLLLLTLLISHRRNDRDLILVIMGMTVLTSGMASALNFSPLLTNFLVGIWLANLSRDKERIYEILITIEKPAYLLLLVFLGAGIRFQTGWIILLALGYCVYRLLGKFLAGFLIAYVSLGRGNYPLHLGYGLVAQGGLPLAMLLDFQQAFQTTVSTTVISVAVLAIMYNEFLSPYFLARLLDREKTV